MVQNLNAVQSKHKIKIMRKLLQTDVEERKNVPVSKKASQHFV